MPEARLEDSGSGLPPVSDGWFVVNVEDAEWWISGWSGSKCFFENEYPASVSTPKVEFSQLGISLTVVEPGQPNGLYHGEDGQEDFLVLLGECLLLVEGEERRLRTWDFFHCAPQTEHIFVGAGNGPCVILMVGARSEDYPGALPGVGARGALRRQRGGSDVRPGQGVCGLRVVTAGAALVLGTPPLGLASSAGAGKRT